MIGVNKDKKLKIALVHDYLNQYGGAERVLECLAEMFPDAPIYTLFYDRKLLRGKFKDRIIKTSFLDNIFVRRHHRLFIPFFPKAVEWLNLKDKYDLIISDSSGFGKGVRHSKGTHISYIHSPLRYAWEPEEYLGTLLPKILLKLGKPILSYVRSWDYKAAQKPDLVIANSQFIADKIKSYYDREAKVIYPPVDQKFFFFDGDSRKAAQDSMNGRYFISFGRMLHYKRFDLVIEAFNKLNLPLILVGAGPHKKKIASLIKSPKIKLLPSPPTDEELGTLIRGAEALIFPQIEDFGLVAAEAVSSGVPVIAYNKGGAKEIIDHGRNGILFEKQNADSIIKAVGEFHSRVFNRQAIHVDSLRFSKANFKRRFFEAVKKALPEKSLAYDYAIEHNPSPKIQPAFLEAE